MTKNTLTEFIKTAKQQKDKLAIWSETGSYTYSELLDQSLKVAYYLKQNNIKPGDHLTIELKRNHLYPPFIFGAWMVGAAVVCADYSYPQERKEIIATDFDAVMRITPEDLDKITDQKLPESEIYEIKPEDFAFAIYTSGSTGKPKGVVHNHYNLYHELLRAVSQTDIRVEDRFASLAPFSFIVGTGASLGIFMTGCSYFVIPDSARMNLDNLATFTAEKDITQMFLPPAMLKYFKQKKNTLRIVSCGGERMTSISPREYKVLNSYGLSESNNALLTYEITQSMDNAPIGTPWEKERIYILDKDGNQALEGEICLAGYFFSEYYKNKTATDKAITPNPFKEQDGFDRLLHTGDYGKRTEDGLIQYLERMDWMVNVNGQRVEPGEVASTISALPQILMAFVKGIEGENGQTYLCAYYKKVAPISEEDIKNYLKTKLPIYMIPSYFVELDAFPLNANGKVDRKSLPDPLQKVKESEIKFDNESLLATNIRKILTECTNRGDYLYEQNLADAGISSMGAIKFAVKIKEEYDYDIDVIKMLQGITIKDLENAISSHLNNKSQKQTTNLQDSYPLTSVQLGMYIEYKNLNDNLSYNIPFAFPINKNDYNNLKAETLVTYLQNIINAHSAITCKIVEKEDGVYMVPQQNPQYNIEVVSGSQDEYETYKKNFVKPFDLSKGVYRFSIFETPSTFYFLGDFHHIMFDGTSAEILKNDLVNQLNGKEVKQEQYTMFDVAIDDKNKRQSPEFNKAREYYANLLNGVDGTTTVEKDLAETNKCKGHITINIDLKNKLSKFIEENKVNENTFFLSGLSILLARYNYVKTSCFATVHSGRNNGKLASTLGMLVQTIPVVGTIEKEQSVGQFVKNIKNQLISSMTADAFSFVDINREFGVNSDIIFVYQGLMNDVEGNIISSIETDDIKNPISIQVYPTKNDFIIDVVYDASMYSSDLMDEFVNSYIATLNNMLVVDKVTDIKIITDNQQKKIEKFNSTEHKFDANLTPIDLINNMVKCYPDNLAVVFEDKKITYSEFGKITDKIASYLSSLGVGEEDFVSILLERNEYMPICAVAVCKTGACYQPLVDSYPVERLNYMVNDCKAKLVITTKKLRPLLNEYNGQVVYIEDLEKIEDSSTAFTLPKPNNACVIIYTSGTTGAPKGCVIEHAQITAYNECYKEIHHLNSNSRVAFYASFGFDAGVQDILTTLCNGATLYIIPESMRLDFAGLDEYFVKNSITNVFMTTQVARMFAQNTKCKTLKYFITGGEALTPFVPPKDMQFLNAYGPSETMCCVISHRVVDDYPIQPIGKAHFNTKLYVIDNDMNLLPPGASGELCIAGLQVSRGYLNRPEKNAEAFVTNPFDSSPDYAKMYRTGDVVRYKSNGDIEFIGRKDSQVKIRGYRIELGEVEKVIHEFDGIENATVQAYDDSAGGKYLCAYIVSRQTVDIEKLKKFIASQKPDYMVPAHIMQLDAIPLNQNQKVDKRALPKPTIKLQDIVPPQTDLQKRIFEKVCEVLGNSEFGIDNDLYLVGLTSIGTLKLNVLLSKEFDVVMKIQTLKEYNTVRKLEQYILNYKSQNDYEILPDYALSKSQEGVFVECVANPNSTIYNIPVLFEIDASIDIQKLKVAIQKTIDAHPFLKTTLCFNEKNEIRQKRNDAVNFDNIEIVEIKNINEIQNNLVQPFDIMGKPLFRVKILKGDKNYLFMDFHHIIFDGTSCAIILEDISNAYLGKELEVEKYSNFEFVLDEEKTNSNLANAKEYYKNLVQDIETKCVPEGDVVGENKNIIDYYRYDSKLLNLDKVKEYCDKNEVSLNGLFTSSFGYLLSRYTHRKDSIFASIYNGRSDARLQKSAGMFVKTMPIVCKIDSNVAISNFVQTISKQLIDSMANDCYAFSEMKKDLDINADILFAYQGDNFEFNSLCGKKAQQIDLKASTPKAKITLFVSFVNGKIVFTAEYCKDYSKHFIRNFIYSLDKVLCEFITKKSLNDVEILCDETLEEFNTFNATDTDYDKSKTVVDLFRETCKKYPNNTALVFQDKSFTYSELDRITDNFAKKLKTYGIGKETTVGVLISRNEYMPISALSVLKAGGAYLPMDTSYPAERLNFMLSDADAKLLITTPQLNEIVKDYDCPRIYTDEILNCENSDIELENPAPQDLFVMLYTSGTTGKPKGVLLEHQNIMAMTSWAHKYYELDETSKWAAYASFGFDANLLDTYPTLTSGATLHIIPEDMRLDLKILANYYNTNGITHGFVTTQIGRQIALMPDFKTLKHLSTGGEKLLALTPPNFNLHNIYGPTETTVLITIYKLNQYVEDIPIGRPLDNIKLYVLDADHKRLPLGAVGELAVSGLQVGRGYKNRPEQKAFTVNPFTTLQDYQRMYLTGDLVQIKEDGQLHYIGRRDGQVKIRGFRIELGEVEKVVREYNGILDATVIALDSPSGGKYLVSYIVSDSKIDTDDLKAFIARSKPSYMVPAVIMQIDKIPLNQNQKVDKRALPKPENVTRENGKECSTELEQKIAKIFGEVLGLDKVYADDDFFAIGGSSISASKVVLKCMNEGLDVVYKNVFDYPTPEKLAGCIIKESKQEKVQEKAEVSIEKEQLFDVLQYNDIKYINDIKKGNLGNVLLVGATGFLGIHILKELIESNCPKIYCVVRKGKTQTSESRLKMLLMYYFDQTYSEKIGEQIVVIDSDIKDPNFKEIVKQYDFDTIINCAASVKHFAVGNALEEINYIAVKNLVDFTLEQNKKFVQVSTLSIAGENVNDKFDSQTKLKENMLWFGQDLENKYAKTKFEAEKYVLEAVQNRGLNGKIIRVGNLMSRYVDGEFQINFTTNAFMSRLKAIVGLGCFSVDDLSTKVEFSPIDWVAKAIITLSATPSKFTVFHANNCHTVHMANVLDAMNKCGINIEVVLPEEFAKRFQAMLANDEQNYKISSLLSYNSEHNVSRKLIDSENDFTVKALYRLGFSWPLIDKNYVETAIKKLVTLGFFDEE